MRGSISIILSIVVYVNGYINMNNFKTNLITNIKVDKTIKKDFKKLNNNDAYKLMEYWHNEIKQASYMKYDFDTTNINYLYEYDDDDLEYNEFKSKNLRNLTVIKYNLLFNKNNKNNWFIWRPNIEIDISRLCLYDISCKIMHNALLYPSIRESIYFVEIDMTNRSYGVIVKNIVKTPYWYNDIYDSSDILVDSLNKYFVSYLKYPEIFFL